MKLDSIKIAFIDFDGTLMKGQSQKMFISFLHKHGFIGYFESIVILSWFLLYKLKLVNDTSAILKFALKCFKGKEVKEIEDKVSMFVSECILPNMYSKSENLIRYFQSKSIKTIIFSAAVDLIIKPISLKIGADSSLSTKVEVKDGVFTGNIVGDQNYGVNKLTKIKQYCEENDININKTISIADHESDIKLLKGTGIGIIANPDKKMHSLAIKNNLPVIYLDIDEPVQYFEFNTLSE